MASVEPDTGSQASSMLVQLTQLDTLLDLAGEIIIVSANLESLNRVVQTANVPDSVAEGTKELSSTSTRISSDLHKLVVDVRNVELRDMFGRFRRLVRDTARRLGKLVEFTVEGESISLDKRIAERIHDPIAHQLRNAIAHGIEDEATRVAAGKGPIGKVGLRVRLLDNCIRIEVSDDGQGVDEEKIRNIALARGLMTHSELEHVTQKELFELLYLPGFSTQQETTTTAGRGVGMDVIRNTLSELDGDVTLTSEWGKGTCLTLELPKVSAVNILDALLVRAGEDIYAFPLSAVLSSATIATKQFVSILGSSLALEYRGDVIPIFDLLQVFERRAPGMVEHGECVNLLLVEHKGRRGGYIIDEFIRPQKLVLSPFDGILEVPAISGSAVLAGRRLAMIVDVPRLLVLSRGEQSLGASHAAAQTREAQAQKLNQTEDSELSVSQEGPAATVPSSPVLVEPATALSLDTSALDFLREQEGLLAKLNAALLSLDETRDAETTDVVFRLAHSVKGNFAMCGMEAGANLTHGLEAVLDSARQGVQPLTDESFDALFDGCSYLEQLTAEVVAGHAPPAPPENLNATIESLTRAAEPKTPSLLPNSELTLNPAASFILSEPSHRGLSVQHLKLRFATQDEPEFLIAYLLLRRLQKEGEVLTSLPSVEQLAAGRANHALEVMLAVPPERAEQLRALEPDLRRLYGVTSLSVERSL